MRVSNLPSAPVPTPAGELAPPRPRRPCPRRVGGGRRPLAGDAAGLRRAVAAVRALVRGAGDRGPRRPRRRRWPPTSPSGPSGRSWPRSGARTRRSPPPAVPPAGADPTKTPLVADTLRGIARQHARQPGAAPRQARELMLVARERRRRGRGLESAATAARRARGADGRRLAVAADGRALRLGRRRRGRGGRAAVRRRPATDEDPLLAAGRVVACVVVVERRPRRTDRTRSEGMGKRVRHDAREEDWLVVRAKASVLGGGRHPGGTRDLVSRLFQSVLAIPAAGGISHRKRDPEHTAAVRRAVPVCVDLAEKRPRRHVHARSRAEFLPNRGH